MFDFELLKVKAITGHKANSIACGYINLQKKSVSFLTLLQLIGGFRVGSSQIDPIPAKNIVTQHDLHTAVSL